ncbi:phage tail tape measure protein [Avibacterium avium]|uniref:Phage-related minor tail protein n=1 Tax=Avibacterium avium TaxID=751 RepID=A0A379ARK0_AVIAV|nr:phage tail tape measure protein [Avibacterium avium]SUB23931.1 Phage-related minor tail protein [Avibacterium avium]
MASNLSIALMIGASVGSAVAGIKRLQNTLHTLRDNTLSTSVKLKNLGAMTILGAGGTITGIKATTDGVMTLANSAIQFESAMADVKKVVDFKSPEGFANLSKDILNLTRTLPMTAEELAAITAAGGQLGVAEEDLKDFTTTIAKMSVAFDMSAEDSGDAMAKLANVYKIPIKEIGKLGDAINELSNSSPAKASDIVSTLGRIGGVAKQFGLSENAAAALSSSFISLGKAPEVAGTAINGMLTKLMTADKGGKKFQEALQSMGLNAKDLKKAIGQDAQGALTSFLKQIQKLPKEKQMGALVDLFGLEYADDVAVLARNVEVLEGSLKTLQETDENGKAKYLGSMEKEFAARSATTENNLKLLSNSFTEIKTTLGSVLLPVINNVVNSIKPLIYWITDLLAKNPAIAEGLLYVAGGLAAAFTGFSALTAVINGVGFVWVSVGTTITKIASFIGGTFNFVSRSFGVITTGLKIGGRLIAVVGGQFFKMGVMFVKALAMMGKAFLTNPIGLAITAIAVGAYLIYQYWEPISAWFSNLWTKVSGYFQNFCTWVQGIWNGATEWVSSAWAGVTDFFSGLLDNILSFFNSGIGNITATILNWSPLGLFQQVFSTVLSWFGIDIPSKFSDFGRNMIDGLVNGIKNAWEGAKQIVSDLGNGIKGWFAEKLGIHSPSRVFKGYGVNVVEGLAIGMNKAQPLAQEATDVLSNSVSLDDKTQGGLLSNYQPLNRNAVTNTETSSAGIVVHFSPNITLTGGDPQGVTDQLQNTLKMGAYEFEQLLNRILDERQRRAY